MIEAADGVSAAWVARPLVEATGVLSAADVESGVASGLIVRTPKVGSEHGGGAVLTANLGCFLGRVAPARAERRRRSRPPRYPCAHAHTVSDPPTPTSHSLSPTH